MSCRSQSRSRSLTHSHRSLIFRSSMISLSPAPPMKTWRWPAFPAMAAVTWCIAGIPIPRPARRSTLKLVYSQYRELQSFAQFGSDLDANTKATLAQGERIVEVLKQHNSSPVEVIHQVAILYAVTKGFLKEVPVEKISEYEAFLYETLDARYAGLLAAIRTAGKLEKETEQQLASAIAETVSAFLAAL